MAPHIFLIKPIKNRPKVHSRISVDEPGDGNSREYHLSHRVHHLLLKSYPLGSVLASFAKCPRLQPHSELLQEHSNCMMLPYGSHAYSSKCKGGTSIPGKSRTRWAPVSPEVPIPPRTGNILHMGEIPNAEQRLPTSRSKPCSIRLQG